MKSADEIKKGLEYLSIKDIVKKLDMWKEGIAYDYAEDAAADALVLIQQLQAENTKLHEANAELCRTAGRLERERDAAVQDIKQMVHDPYEPCFCDYCKLTEEECAGSDCKGRSAFVWRGPQEVTP